jgi:hypothetical protein
MMNDRSRLFLALSAGGLLVSVAACEVIVDKPAKSPPPAPPTPPAAAAQAAPAQAAPAAPKEVKVAPLHLHGAQPAPSGGGTVAPAAACLDTGTATVGDCAAMQASTACPAAPTPQQKCNAYKTYFAPKVAAAAVACLTALSSAQVCDPNQVSGCGHAALAQACPVPAVAQLCQIAAGPCKTTATDCTSALSGLDDQGQQAVAQCVAQGCGAGLLACIDGLGLARGATAAAVTQKH